MKSRLALLKVVAVCMSVLVGLIGTAVYAQGPEPTNPVVTQTTNTEWVLQKTQAGEVRVPVQVTQMKVTEKVVVPAPARPKTGRITPNEVVGDVVVTLERSLYWYPDPGNPSTYSWVDMGGRTSTDKCVDEVGIDQIEHQYFEPGCNCWIRQDVDSSWALWGCKNNSGEARTAYTQFFNGNRHRAVANEHRTTINGVDYSWYREGPEQVVP